VKVLEPFVHLEGEHDARIDVVPREANEPGEVDRVERLDERRVAELREDVRLRERHARIDGVPVDVALYGPAAAVGRARVARVERLEFST
jgi:hypothetical protein